MPDIDATSIGARKSFRNDTCWKPVHSPCSFECAVIVSCVLCNAGLCRSAWSCPSLEKCEQKPSKEENKTQLGLMQHVKI
eukprot:1820139-Amphidinium_carterae.2